MSTSEVVNVSGEKYELMIEAERVVGIRRFNTKHRLWIVMRFTDEGGDDSAKDDLMALLTDEYVRRNIS